MPLAGVFIALVAIKNIAILALYDDLNRTQCNEAVSYTA